MTAITLNELFASWAQAPSTTEADKIQHAVDAIKKAIDSSADLSSITKLFVQGSYRNRVNVRQDSDVDIGVLYTGNTFFTQFPPGKANSDFQLVDSPFQYGDFKNQIGAALSRHFGSDKINRGPKAFDVHANSYRVEADVVPLLVHRRYSQDGSFVCGTELRPDVGNRIINWPERLYDNPTWRNQHYENGNAKNSRTARSYRGVVRILKKLRNGMDEGRVAAAAPIKGYLVECLVWNVPDECFAHVTWIEDVVSVLSHLSTHTSSSPLCGDWTEVSGHKWLFKGDETKRTQAAAFVSAARQYIRV